MTNFAQTVSNRISPLGGGVTQKWGTAKWGQLWGEGTIGFVFRAATHQFASPCTVGTIEHFAVVHGYDDAQGSDSGNMLAPAVLIGTSLTMLSNPDDMRLKDSAGYDYVFPSNAADLLDRDFPVYTSAAAATSTWASATAGTPVWSAV